MPNPLHAGRFNAFRNHVRGDEAYGVNRKDSVIAALPVPAAFTVRGKHSRSVCASLGVRHESRAPGLLRQTTTAAGSPRLLITPPKCVWVVEKRIIDRGQPNVILAC